MKNKNSLQIQDSEHEEEQKTQIGQKINNTQRKPKLSTIDSKEHCKKIKRRRFIEKSLPILEKNIEALSCCIKDYSVYSELAVSAELCKPYQLVSMFEPDYQEKVDISTWKKLNSSQNSFFSQEIKHTVGDTKVRSKSEAIICNLLETFNIPFKYETCLSIGKVTYYPDFVILNPIDNKVVYWEHFGKINDKDYVESFERKLATYRINGITLWNNLIITFDQPDGSLDVRKIEKLIRTFFVV